MLIFSFFKTSNQSILTKFDTSSSDNHNDSNFLMFLLVFLSEIWFYPFGKMYLILNIRYLCKFLFLQFYLFIYFILNKN